MICQQRCCVKRGCRLERPGQGTVHGIHKDIGVLELDKGERKVPVRAKHRVDAGHDHLIHIHVPERQCQLGQKIVRAARPAADCAERLARRSGTRGDGRRRAEDHADRVHRAQADIKLRRATDIRGRDRIGLNAVGDGRSPFEAELRSLG